MSNIYTLKELREVSTEELIIKLLMMDFADTTKTERQNEERVLRILDERNIIDFDKIKEDLIRKCIW